MEDARRTPSLCNDSFAERFMDERGMQIFAPFKSETMPNISNILRCRIIDGFVRNSLSEDAESLVISIGAGFDSRPYRLNGGNWVELDEPQIINYKNEKLPIAECKNILTRMAIDFSSETITEKLMSFKRDKPIIIVIEGVFMYLEPETIEDTLRQIQSLCPRHVLLCDLITRKFFEKFATRVHAKLVSAGGQFTERPEHPEAIFAKNGYVVTSHTPMFRRATELGVLWEQARIPTFIAKLLLGVLMKDMNGYAVYRFEYG
jgi:methyltransferase (TIGR00027 family)